ncbi:MAG: Gfo/Idh/MocA family oxidoreductase [Puniceicoccaceae bacterium]
MGDPPVLSPAHRTDSPTTRKLIDDGWIGRPLIGTAFMLGHGHESWHPNPGFYYEAGGGPLFDMGPYYLTALVNLLGPVKSVMARTAKGFEERVASSQGNEGKRLPVAVNTRCAGVLEFASGAIVTITVSFDVWKHHLSNLAIHVETGCERPEGLRAGLLPWEV